MSVPLSLQLHLQLAEVRTQRCKLLWYEQCSHPAAAWLGVTLPFLSMLVFHRKKEFLLSQLLLPSSGKSLEFFDTVFASRLRFHGEILCKAFFL